MDATSAIDAAAVRRFAGSLEHPHGGFRAGVFDDTVDVEYTFYGLGTLALLAAVEG
jgi:geranylgeranyl transferase type-2 subunit beta